MNRVHSSSFRFALLLALAASGLLLAGASHAATLTVDDDAAQCPARTHSTIQAAVTAAAAGDTINVCPGTYGPFSTMSKNGLTIRSTNGPGSTLVRGFANGCYGIFIPSGTGVTIDGFDISPSAVTSGSSCDWAAIATSSNVFDLAIRNNIVHDILAPGSRSCGTGSGSYGIFGLVLNDIHRAVIENNVFYNINATGCTPVGSYSGSGTTIKSFASSVQVMFVSGSNSNPSPGGDLITVRNNTIQSAAGFNPTSIRVKRSTNFVVTGNQISGLTGTDGTPSYPSTTRGLNPQGSPTTASSQGLFSNNVIAAHYGAVIEDYHGTQVTGNDLSAIATTNVAFVRGNNNYACLNTLGSANFTLVTPATGNQFPGGSAYTGNSECPQPTITCPAPVNVQCDGDVPPANPNSIVALDNCIGGPAVVTHRGDSSAAGTCPRIITRTYRATDACGNTTDCTQTITVQDTIAPVVVAGTISSCYPTQAAAEAAALAATTATDNCGVVTKSVATSGACSATITVTGTDPCGNAAQVTYSTRIDNTSPTVTAGTIASCFSNQAQAEAAALAATTVTDNCPGTVAKTVSTTGTCSATITVTGTDACGNASSVSYSASIDGQAPTIACPADLLVQCVDDVPAPQPGAVSASDNCGVAVVSFVGDVTTGSSCDMTIARTYRATDACGNTSDCTQMITVRDTFGPTVTAGSSDLYCLQPPNHQYYCFTQADFPGVGPGLSDNCNAAPLTWVFTGCASSQADTGAGDSTVADCVVAPDGLSFKVRAERDPRKGSDGRRYSVTVRATDACGNAGPEARIGYILVPKGSGSGCLTATCGQ